MSDPGSVHPLVWRPVRDAVSRHGKIAQRAQYPAQIFANLFIRRWECHHGRRGANTRGGVPQTTTRHCDEFPSKLKNWFTRPASIQTSLFSTSITVLRASWWPKIPSSMALCRGRNSRLLSSMTSGRSFSSSRSLRQVRVFIPSQAPLTWHHSGYHC